MGNLRYSQTEAYKDSLRRRPLTDAQKRRRRNKARQKRGEEQHKKNGLAMLAILMKTGELQCLQQ